MRLQNAVDPNGPGQQHPLQFFESASNVRQAVQNSTGRAPNAKKSKDIATFIQQGRMFFEAADEASIEIRPLILYYGMMAFAKAIILSRTLTNIEALPQRHGLTDISPQTALLMDLTLRIEQSGTFQQFNDVVAPLEGITYFARTQADFYNTPAATSQAISGQNLTLKKVLSHCASVAGLYESTVHEANHTLPYTLYFPGAAHGVVEMRIDLRDVVGDLKELRKLVADCRTAFPSLANWRFRNAMRAWNHTIITFDNKTKPADDLADAAVRVQGEEVCAVEDATAQCRDFRALLTPATSSLAYSNWTCFTAPIAGNYISEASLQYLGMFLLGSLVRYRPQTWVHATTRFVSSERPADDAPLALIEQFMTVVQERFPALLVRLLSRS